MVQLNKRVADVGNDYQKAAELYQEFLENHPQTAQKTAIEQELARLKEKIALQRQWLNVRKYASNPDLGIFERIQYVDSYIRDNPSSPFAAEAQNLLVRLDSQHQALQQQEQRRVHAQEEQARIQKERELAAQRKTRLAAIANQLNRQLADSQRYQANGDGTMTDRETRATWTLLDSYQELDGCINYENALAYVKTIDQGGYRDWRLPTANELASLYKKKPYFPASGAQWYWSSNAYAKGFHTVVDIVTAKPETIFEWEYRAQDDCGAVRAIRP